MVLSTSEKSAIEPTSLRSAGMYPRPDRHLSRVDAWVISRPSSRILAPLRLPESGQYLCQFTLPVAGDSGDAEDFALRYRKRSTFQSEETFVVERSEVFYFQDALPFFDLRFLHVKDDVSPHHFAGQALLGCLPRLHACDDFATAQHRDSVTDREHDRAACA